MTQVCQSKPADTSPGWNLRKGEKDYRKAKPRGKPFQKGRDPRRYTSKNADFARIARQYGDQAISTILEVMTDPNSNDRARLEAAKFIIERGFGKADARHLHKVDAGNSFLDALRAINAAPQIEFVEGEVREVKRTAKEFAVSKEQAE